jgi:hypothetical protein
MIGAPINSTFRKRLHILISYYHYMKGDVSDGQGTKRRFTSNALAKMRWPNDCRGEVFLHSPVAAPSTSDQQRKIHCEILHGSVYDYRVNGLYAFAPSCFCYRLVVSLGYLLAFSLLESYHH